jgi:hypothetical protein
VLYTFEDLETGDVRSAIAINEAAARLRPGGIWTDVERTAAWEPCEIDGLPAMLHEAQAVEQAAVREMEQANPVGRGPITTPEALAFFTAAEERHRRCQARREELMHLMIAAGR